LNGDSSCSQSPGIVVAKENCLPYKLPGAGTAYSFRFESYRLPHLADLILSSNILKTDGILQQGLMVNLGNVPLEEVTLQTRGMKFLVDFMPGTNPENLLKLNSQLSKGIQADGFLYRLGFYVDDQVTFALRSIAYKGKVMRSAKGMVYNELSFDKRKDIVVAFRVVEKEPNGNITILWKILSQQDAPNLKTGAASD
jgi:hypothetical protein